MDKQTLSYKRFKYRFCPLVETIFEVKFGDGAFDGAVPGQIYEKIRDEFPQKKDVKTIAFGIVSADASPPPLRVPSLQAWDIDETKCLQFGNGIIAANERQYVDWEHFLPSIRQITDSYISVASPSEIERVGLRFINRIIIPEDVVDMSKYFQIGLSIPEALKNTHAFDVSLHAKSQHGPNVKVKVRFASDSLKDGESGVAFILDLDASFDEYVAPTVDDVLSATEDAHNYIGYLFENIIQDPTREVLGGNEV